MPKKLKDAGKGNPQPKSNGKCQNGMPPKASK